MTQCIDASIAVKWFHKGELFENEAHTLLHRIIGFFKAICFEIGERYWFEFDAIGTDGDHVWWTFLE